MSVMALGVQLRLMPYTRDREDYLATASHVLVFFSYFSAMLGKLDPSTFKGFDGDLIGWLLWALAMSIVVGGVLIVIVELVGFSTSPFTHP